MRKKWRDKEIKQVQGEKKEKGNRRKSLNLLLLLLLALILNPLILKPVLAAPSKGYEKLEYEKIFEKKDPDGRMYSEWDEGRLNPENDYYENIIDEKIYKPDGTFMKEDYLPIAKFKIEVYRGGKISGNNVKGGALIFQGETSSEIVKHLGELQVGDIVKITDTSQARVGTLDIAAFNGVVREPGYDYNMPNGFGGELPPGGSRILELKDKGSHRIALQVKLKERAYSEKDKSHYDIWSANGAIHAWGEGYYGESNTPWEGWSHFTGVTFDVAGKSQADMVMRELELIDPETGEVVESFKREIDNLEPFNTNKEKLIRTNSDPRNASGLKKGKKYKVRAKYQYISFEEGKFDISKPELMTDKQRGLSTGVIPNELDVHYSYDDNVFKDGVFDESFKKISTDKPNIELKNLEYATFEWEGKTGLGNKE